MSGIIVISADTSHLKTWLAQAISVGALMKNPGVVNKIIHLDFDTTMATYKDRKITPFNMEDLDKNGRKISCRIDSIAKNMEFLSNQGYYQYIDNRQLSLYCEKYIMWMVSLHIMCFAAYLMHQLKILVQIYLFLMC